MSRSWKSGLSDVRMPPPLAALPGNLAFGVVTPSSQVSGTTAYGERWIEQFCAHYDAEEPRLLATCAVATAHRQRSLRSPTCSLNCACALTTRRPIAAVVEPQLPWMAGELNLTSVAAAGPGSVEGDRLVDPEAHVPRTEIGHAEEAAAFKKSSRMPLPEAAKHPGKPIEVLRHGRASHWPEPHHPPRVGATRRASDADGRHRFDSLCARHSIHRPPARPSGMFPTACRRNSWGLPETFAREARAATSRIVLLVLDNAGWHGPANLKIPDGVRLIYLPPYHSIAAHRRNALGAR